MTPQELKASILQMAIQGKLVEQSPSEAVPENIAANALVRNCEDIPFEIPDTWCWCYLEDIATLHNGRAYKKPEMLRSGKYPLLRVGNLFTSDTWYYSDMELEPEKYCDNGDLLYAWSASFGPHVWNGGKVIYHYHIWKVELRDPQMRDYLYWALAAQTDAIKRRGHGLTMIHITKAGTEKMLIPVPPVAEQKRIVAKIEELLPLIDCYEQAWSKLEAFNKRFPVDMQKSILHTAIQGKLVPQLSEEGTGEELFRQIQAEKQSLIKSGTIKKEKPLPAITEDEIPFDIPESWKWVRVAQIVTLNPKNDLGDDLETAFIPMPCVLDGFRNQHTFEIKKWKEIKKGFTHFAEGDVGVAKITPCFQNRKSVIFRNLINGYGAGTTELSVVRTLNETVLPEYLLWFFKTEYFITNGVKSFTGTAGQQRIHKDYLATCLIPLPPLAEQKRIVAKLEEILPLCERLK